MKDENIKGSSSLVLVDNLFVVSILDCEEAALADPRFDILMICRKVCANRQQATYVLERYSSLCSIESSMNPIKPSLKLESVHSIITLLLQAFCISIGRNFATLLTNNQN
jgi:hypothetical protein